MASQTSQIGLAPFAAKDRTLGDSRASPIMERLPFTVTFPFRVMPLPSMMIVPAFPKALNSDELVICVFKTIVSAFCYMLSV